MNATASKILVGLLVFFAGSFAFFGIAIAQTSPAEITDSSAMWDAFLFGGDDVSLVVLKEIIGDWTGLSPHVQPIFAESIKLFNLAVLAFGSSVFAYTALVGTLQSAHDGQLLGKTWSTVWVPFRFTTGVVLLIPTVSGLCLAQLGMLWMLSQGVGLASNVWHGAVKSYSDNGAQYMAGHLATEDTVREAMKGIFANEMCLAVMRRTSDPDLFARKEVTMGYKKVIYWGGIEGSGYPMDLCGQVGVDTASSRGVIKGAFVGNTTLESRAALGAAQYDALALAANSFEGIASAIMSVRPDEEINVEERMEGINTGLKAAYLVYQRTVTDAIKEAVKNENAALTKQLVDSAARDGWFTAGTWFYQIARSNEELNGMISDMPAVQTNISEKSRSIVDGGNTVIDGLAENEKDFIRAALAHADKLFMRNTRSLSEERINPGTHKNGMIYMLQAANLGGVDKGGASSDSAVEFGYDPSNPSPAIIQLKNVGDYMIGGAITAIAIGKAAEVALQTAKDASEAVKEVAKVAGPKGQIAKLVLQVAESALGTAVGYLSGILTFVGIALFATGILLAFWLPMLPFVNWIGGIIGWVVASLEMLIATPVWLAAHLHPEGEGVASRYAASGYMIILELLLRPVLMVFGLIIAIIIADPILNFVASQFFHALATTGEDSLKLLVAYVMKLVLFTVVCWIAVNYTFKAINSVPNGVMRWIGGMAGSNSDMGEGVGENTKAIVVAGAHKMTGSLQMGNAIKSGKDSKAGAANMKPGGRSRSS